MLIFHIHIMISLWVGLGWVELVVSKFVDALHALIYFTTILKCAYDIFMYILSFYIGFVFDKIL